MIDLSPQPHDKASDTAELQSGPHHDPIAQAPSGEPRHRDWGLTHDNAEAGIQLLSRWAGPVAMAATLCLLAWWLIA